MDNAVFIIINYKSFQLKRKMLSKLVQRNKLPYMVNNAARAFSASGTSKKPSIGDAVTILQSKVSGINQVVSISN